jgi:hypothetical protein
MLLYYSETPPNGDKREPTEHTHRFFSLKQARTGVPCVGKALKKTTVPGNKGAAMWKLHVVGTAILCYPFLDVWDLKRRPMFKNVQKF